MNNKVDERGSPITAEAYKWPSNNEMVIFDSLISQVREALQIAIDKGEKVYEDGIEWKGLEQGKICNHVALDPQDALHADSLSYSRENQRDAFEVIISIALQLGMEQGRRDTLKKIEDISCVFTSDTGKKAIEIMLGKK
jgi:hypothetical protein